MLAEVQKMPAVQAFESTVSKLAAAVLPPAKPKTTVMLLSEPVVILTGTSDGWQHLEAGKQVTLIANEGRFIRVKYEEKEVCIPRSAVTNGIASFR